MKKIKFKNLAIVIAFMFGSLSPASQVMAQPESTRAGYQAGSEGIATDRIIVKYKSGTNAPVSPSNGSQMNRLSNKAGVSLLYVRTMAEGDTHVLQLPERLSQDQVQAISNQLMTLPEVEYAEPDRIVRHTLVPDDTEYVNQWHYFDTWGINAPAAWDITTGVSSIVVAVIDTGITNHADLSGRTVSGYDFIGDTLIANDGGGRDADPSDPGDWITVAEDSEVGGYFEGCGASYSSWHGTHVAGTIGAASNNTAGVAGINWNSMILPVRVLGKCGGYTSDVVDGMRWAAGLSVSGVPANANPAKVLNLSLGGTGACSVTEQSAINEITTAGAVIVVAAGNEYGDASNFSPGNCNGVITVAATDRSGQKASYSNSGSVVEISAPGGDGADGVLSTLDTGTTVPAGDTYVEYIGTSMATPHVSGVLSLMFSVNPYMSPAQALQLLQQTAKAFPGGGTCTTSNCGSGIVNAAAAVAAAQAPDLIITGYELVDPVTGLPLASAPTPNETFGIKAFVKNQGGSATAGVFYRSVFVDRNPMNPALFEITSPAGCLFNLNFTPPDSDSGDYFIDNYFGGLPAGATDTDTIVEVTGGLPVGSYQIWLYADPTCIVDNESIENNNSYGPISVNVGGGGYPSGPTDIDVTIAGTLRGTYPMNPDTSQVVKYLVDGGPVEISSNNGVGIIASLNQWRRNAAQPEGWFTGVAQSMALPVEQITNQYVMPRYNGTEPTLFNAVLMANVDTVPRTLTVTIGGTAMGAYTLNPSASMYATYNVTGGPVVVSSDTGAKIVASLYELKRYQAGVPWNGQSEMMGLPWGQLSDKYLLPLYFGAANPATLDARLYIANVDTIATTVEVKIAGVSRGTYLLQPSTSMVAKYLVDGGPVEISSNNGAKIVASLNQWRRNAAEPEGWFTGVAQSMALPVEQITNKYVIPRYNGTEPTLFNAVLMANVDTVPRTLTVTIGGTVMGAYSLAPSASVYATYNIADGPIVVSSDTGAKIVASLYELKRYQAGVPWNGQSEMMGLPWGQLSDKYLLPIYFGAANPLTLDARLYIAVP